MVHHKACWDENGGCTTFGCTGKAKGTVVCFNCGADIAENQAFCTKCGSPKPAEAVAQSEDKPNLCHKCNALLAEGQKFCSNCGAGTETVIVPAVSPAINDYNASVVKKPKKNKLIIAVVAPKIDGETDFEIDVEGATGNEAPAPKFCSACGEKLAADARFCGKCGKPLAAVNAPAQTADANPVVANAMISNASQAYHNFSENGQNDADDAKTNKWMAALSYLAILLIIPYLKKRNSPFVKFHLNQGTLCFAILLVSLLAGWLIPYIGSFISGVGTLAYCVLALIGIINCINCEKKRLPVIGKYEIIK